MPRFLQVVLQPGVIRLAAGQQRRLTAKDLQACAAQTKALLQRGYLVPVLARHAVPGASHGAPLAISSPRGDRESQRAARARRVGRLLDIASLPGGALAHWIEVTDVSLAEHIAQGRIRFTSPELRTRFVDAEGRSWGPLVAHVALTTQPRFTRQRPLVVDDSHGAAWRRLLSTGEFPMLDGSVSPEPNEPTPADSMPLRAPETADDDRPNAPPESEHEERAPQPETDVFESDTRDAPTLVSPICQRLANRIRSSNRLPRGVRERLAGVVEAIQLAEEGEGEPTLGVAQTLELLEESLPPQLALAAERLVTSAHPRGDAFFATTGRELSDNEAARIAAAQLAAAGFARAKTFP